MAKKSRLTWWRVHSIFRRSFERIPPEKIGKAFLLAMDYFDAMSEEIQSERTFEVDDSILDNIDDQQVLQALTLFKDAIDDGFLEYMKRVDDGRRGWSKSSRNPDNNRGG